MADGSAQLRAGSLKTRTILGNVPIAMADGGAQPRASPPKARTILEDSLIAMVDAASGADSLLRANQCTSRPTANVIESKEERKFSKFSSNKSLPG